MHSFFEEIVHRWPAGREDYHWHVLFDPDVVQKQLLDPYAELVEREGVAPVAAEWVHLTVLHSGPVEQISREEIAAITDQVRQKCAAIAPFPITLERPSVGRVAVECAGRPGAPARRLWQITSEATSAVIGDRFAVVPSVYYPHTSLGYGVSPSDHRPMKAWLSDAETEPVTLPVTRLSLVAQSHDMRHITWRHISDVPLAG